MIAQLMVEHRGLFRSWEPYAALQTFTYHFGFHAHVAAITWMTGIATPRAVVLTGQIANIAAVLASIPWPRAWGGAAGPVSPRCCWPVCSRRCLCSTSIGDATRSLPGR